MILAVIVLIAVAFFVAIVTPDSVSQSVCWMSGALAAVIVLVVAYNTAKPNRFICFSEAKPVQYLVAMPIVCKAKLKT